MRLAFLAAELLVLFVGIPSAILARVVPRVPIAVLLVASAGCAVALLRDPTFERTRLWNAAGAASSLAGALGMALVVILASIALVAWWTPSRLFDLPRTRPALWAVIMVLYPLLSVYPQELIYRAFFFHRYAALLPSVEARILVSAALFAFAHVFFPRPWVAMGLTFAGGLLFGWHYERSRSLCIACVEHALFGQTMFTVGLGRFFYAGQRRIEG